MGNCCGALGAHEKGLIHMRKLAILVAATAVMATFPALAQSPTPLTPAGWNHGCFRWGETGHHWYDFCVGPDFLYPHHKNCDKNGFCTFT
jgi:hypothetical protein